MTIEDQKRRAACDRNLKQKYHGVLVKSLSIVYDDIRKEYKALITVQLPFFDISIADLMNWVIETFPDIGKYILENENEILLKLQIGGMTVRVTYLGRDRYAPKCDLYDLQVSVVDYSYGFRYWNKEVVQGYLDRCACKVIISDIK